MGDTALEPAERGQPPPDALTHPRGWTTIENGVAADCEPRLSVETRLNENVPAVVGVPAMRVPLSKRWMLVPGGNEPWTTR
jgi:hypothetical protein